jgi:two-component system, chemotaxis family, CheB/CheR fusion protein
MDEKGKDSGRIVGIVGIGASAGGLQALRPVIRGLEPRGDRAYIVAHHQSPTQESRLTDLLAAGSALSVVPARQGERPRADHVYVVPPGQDVELQGDVLALLPKEEASFISPSVDRLFRSLAKTRGEGAIAIVLSGSGRDGAAGAGAVKEAGGVVMAQLPDEALQPGMPEAAIDTGCVDYVGTTEQIRDWLNGPDPLRPTSGDRAEHRGGGTFGDLFRAVGAASGIDLGQYKESTLRRQTVRRFTALGYTCLPQYMDYVRAHPEELALLQQSYLISVSSFFRDAAAFASLSVAIRNMVAHKKAGDALRVWVPGCATGEEAYSIAILVAEILGDRLEDFDVRIFASDIDQAALDYARAGLYSEKEAASLDHARRERWFASEGDAWRIAKLIRERCVFARHDVIANPPFIRMDVLSCRNLLIYFTAEQQAELISTFHYALNPDGLLLLGKSESTGSVTQSFEVLDGSNKLYRRRADGGGHVVRHGRLALPFPANRSAMPTSTATSRRQQLVNTALSTIARDYGPPGVLTNGHFEPLHFFGRAQRFFVLPQGSAEFTVFSLCLPALRGELKAMCYRCVQEDIDSVEGLVVDLEIEGQCLRVRPTLRRVTLGDGGREFAFLLVFEELGRPEQTGLAAADGPANADVLRLQQELVDTREHLQSVIDEMESSNEELQSMQEELQSSSEELQSSNEELQASNEELTTVNEELRLKSLESAQLSTTLSNIQNSVRTSLVVVDRAGRITRYNELATRIFGIVGNDLGQFLYGVPCHLHLPDLRGQVNHVVTTGESLLERVHDGDFFYLMRIDPYHNEAGETAGAVLTFSDISDLHRAEEARRSIEIRFRRVWEASLEGLVVSDNQGRIVLANPAAEQMFRYGEGELVGKGVDVLVPAGQQATHQSYRRAFVAEGHQTRKMTERPNIAGRRKDGSEFPVEVSLSAFELDGQTHVLASVADVTAARRATRDLADSEARLRLFIEHAPAAIAMFDRQMRYLAVSRRWREDYALGDAEIVGRSHYEVFPEIPEEWKVIHRRGLAGEVIRADEDRFERADGTVQWLRWEVRPWYLTENSVGGVLIFTEDITVRKEAEARSRQSLLLQQEFDILQSVLETSLAGYWDWNIAEGTEYMSPTFKAMFGYRDDEMPNSPETWQKLIHPEDLPRLMEVFRRHVDSQGREPFYNEVRYRHKNGSTVWVICAGRVVQWTANGDPIRMVGCHIDVTPLHQQVEGLMEANLKADSANRAKSAFLANMSHEIRTPINAIVGMAHILRRRLQDPEHLGMLSRIDSSAEHLLAVINDILDISKIEADKLTLHFTEFDLQEVAANVASMLAERAAAKGLDLDVECEPLRHRARGDVTRFTQALLNLATNAVKFTEAGQVRIALRQAGQAGGRILVRVEVQDTGIGIAPEVLSNLFRPFEQGDVSTTRKYGGTGLGLVITKRLAQLMGGDAGASSELGKGSTFWFTAWLEIGAGLSRSLQVGRVEAPLVSLQREFPGARLLLAEDEPVNQEVATMILEEAGLDITVANNGREAVDQARQGDFDLALMDMQMPELDGLDACRQIRRLPAWANRPIVAMTANAFAEDRKRCFEAGFDDFVTKPVDPDRLFEIVLHWLRFSRSGPAA